MYFGQQVIITQAFARNETPRRKYAATGAIQSEPRLMECGDLSPLL
jgi:hypothetical protein